MSPHSVGFGRTPFVPGISDGSVATDSTITSSEAVRLHFRRQEKARGEFIKADNNGRLKDALKARIQCCTDTYEVWTRRWCYVSGQRRKLDWSNYKIKPQKANLLGFCIMVSWEKWRCVEQGFGWMNTILMKMVRTYPTIVKTQRRLNKKLRIQMKENTEVNDSIEILETAITTEDWKGDLRFHLFYFLLKLKEQETVTKVGKRTSKDLDVCWIKENYWTESGNFFFERWWKVVLLIKK